MNSTIIRKKKKLKCGCFDYAFSNGLCKSHATVQSTQKRIDKHNEELEGESFKNLTHDLDEVFSKYIRLKYSNSKGMVRCYTSGKEMRWQDAQCGHFISRKHLATRWLESNCRVQSEHDNCFLHGNLDIFETKLEQEQKGLPEQLRELSRDVYKPTITELKQLLAEYRHKYNFALKKIK